MKSGVFFALLVLGGTGYVLYWFFSGNPPQPFSAPLLQVDTAKVTSLLIEQNNGTTAFSFLRQAEGWILSSEQTNSKAATAVVQTLLSAWNGAPTQAVVGKDRAAWKTFGVDAAQGVRVRLYQADQLLEDFVVGNADTDSQTQAPRSYLRLSGATEVYAVQGEFAAFFHQDFSTLRNATLLQLEPTAVIIALELKLSDTTLQLQQTPTGWKMDTLRLDSAAVHRYLQQLHQVRGTTFADDFDEVHGSKYRHQTLTIKVKNREEPFVLTCYRDSLRQPPFVLHSSQNPETFFESDSMGIYRVVFEKVKELVKRMPDREMPDIGR